MCLSLMLCIQVQEITLCNSNTGRSSRSNYVVPIYHYGQRNKLDFFSQILVKLNSLCLST